MEWLSHAWGKTKESVSGATAGLSNAVGFNAAPADPNADLMQKSAPVNTPAVPAAPAAPLTNGGRRRRVRKTKKGSSRRSRRKMSRSNK